MCIRDRLYHHSFWFVSEEGKEVPNVDDIAVGVFPKHNDNMRLEVAWTILPFFLIIWLTYVSWAPLDAMWTSPEGGNHGLACDDGSTDHDYTVNQDGIESSNNSMDSTGMITSDCYHVIEITGQQWFWNFDCLDLSEDICSTGYSSSGGETRPMLNLTAGETYLARMVSIDVTHAVKNPAFGIMEDVVPGQETYLWMPAVEETSFLMLCAEYCGDNHAYMTAQMNVNS